MAAEPVEAATMIAEIEHANRRRSRQTERESTAETAKVHAMAAEPAVEAAAMSAEEYGARRACAMAELPAFALDALALLNVAAAEAQLGLGHIVASHRRPSRRQCSDLTHICIGMHRNAPLSPMKEGARVHHSYGSYAPSTYGSYEPRRANPSTAVVRFIPDSLT
jgi:hypothetical protein